MQWLSHVLAVASVWLVAAVSPGPNFLMTARIAVARSRGSGFAAVCGIGIATAIWGVCGLAGIKAIFLAAPWAKDVGSHPGVIPMAARAWLIRV